MDQQVLTAAVPAVAVGYTFAGYRVAGLPLVECYLTSTVRPDAHLNTTQIQLPLMRLTA